MSAPVTSISTGPRTPQGKATSALNALTHGLTSKSPVLPSELPAQFEAFRATVLDRFSPKAPEDVATVLDYIDCTWRLRRIAVLEAELITIEIKRLADDPQLAQLLPNLTVNALEALAIERLFASKALVNLHRLEDRLSRRLARIQPPLDFLADRANEREYTRRQTASTAAKLHIISKNEKNELPLAGRNDFCPCGSGLKFKRCCLDKPLFKPSEAA